MTRTAYLALAVIISTPVHAAEATCDAFTHATGANQFLFEKYIFGQVSARMKGKKDDAIRQATQYAVRLTDAYCLQNPYDKARRASNFFSDIAAQGKSPLFRRPPQSR